MKHKARKRFGQNFLVDGAVIARIISAIAPQPGERLVEIGPGQEALTAPLMAAGANLQVVEIDRDLAARLQQRHPQLEVINEDALRVDFTALAAGASYRLVGNLPYNISTPLLFHLLAQQQPPSDMHFMLQKEVVERMHALPGSKAYGRLSLMCQVYAEVTPLFPVPPTAFDRSPIALPPPWATRPTGGTITAPSSPCLPRPMKAGPTATPLPATTGMLSVTLLITGICSTCPQAWMTRW